MHFNRLKIWLDIGKLSYLGFVIRVLGRVWEGSCDVFSGVLRFTLSGRSVIIISIGVRLVSLWFCFSSFVLIYVLVLLLDVRMLMILFSWFSFRLSFLCLSLGCGVVIPSVWLLSLLCGVVLPFCVFYYSKILLLWLVFLSFGLLLSFGLFENVC